MLMVGKLLKIQVKYKLEISAKYELNRWTIYSNWYSRRMIFFFWITLIVFCFSLSEKNYIYWTFVEKLSLMIKKS